MGWEQPGNRLGLAAPAGDVGERQGGSDGRHKVFFGSNHPFWPAKDCLVGLGGLGLDDRTERLFLAENAKRVVRLDGGASS